MRFSTKLTMGFLLILTLTFGLGGSLLILFSANQALSRAEDAAMSSHRMMMYTLEKLGGDSSSADGYQEAEDAAGALDGQSGKSWLSFRLTDSQETIIYRSVGSTLFQSGLSDSADATHCTSVVFRDGNRYLFQVTGWFETTDNSLCLDAVYDVTSVYEARSSQIALYMQLFAVVVALGSALSWVLSRLLTQPLRKLSRATRALTSGDLSTRVDIRGEDEIGRLSADFNQMANQLEENIDALKDSMKRQEEFMGGFAHELKTPLTSIIGYADLLRSQELSKEEQQEATNYIFSEGKRLESLSLKLLDLIVMKREDFVLIPTHPAEVVRYAATLLQPALEKQHILLYTRCGKGTALLEPNLVQSMVVNLVDNARKAINGKGNILLETWTEADGCVFRVTDNGRGIPPEALSRITEAFYRVDKSRSRAQGGVGLGLSLCREIAELHHGTIHFESILGKGTRVTATLKGGSCVRVEEGVE